MKDLILISENLLTDGIIPSDLLDPKRFDLRTVQDPHEIAILAKMTPPKAIVIDLESLHSRLNDFVDELKNQNLIIPILGILKTENENRSTEWFKAGINDLLVHPFGADELRESLQILMGLKFRRFERKPIDFHFTLTLGDQNWSVMGKIINRECILVQGNQTPSEGNNVFITSAELDPLGMSQWCYCWKTVKGGLLLRFLKPSEDLLQKIDALPSLEALEKTHTPFSTKTTPSEDLKPETSEFPPSKFPKVTIPTEKLQNAFIDNPHALTPLDLDQALPVIQKWAQKKEQSPFPWPKILAELSPKELNAICNPPATIPNLHKYLCIKVLLETQSKGLQSAFMTGKDFEFSKAQEILQSHVQLLNEINKELQSVIVKFIEEKNNQEVENLNQLKSSLQKTMVNMKKTLRLRKGLTSDSDPFNQPISIPKTSGGATPLKTSTLPTRKTIGIGFSRRLEKVFFALMVLTLIGGTFTYTFFKISKPQRKISQLTPEQVQDLSIYFESVQQYKEKGKLHFSIRMKKEWDSLDESIKKTEFTEITEKFKLRKITFVELQSFQGKNFALFNENQMKVIKLPEDARLDSKPPNDSNPVH